MCRTISMSGSTFHVQVHHHTGQIWFMSTKTYQPLFIIDALKLIVPFTLDREWIYKCLNHEKHQTYQPLELYRHYENLS